MPSLRFWRRRPVEERSGEWGTEHLVPLPWQGMFAHTGRVVTTEVAAGLPAVASAILRVSEIVAALPIIVYRGSGAGRQRADTAWQYRLLHDAPSLECSAFDFVQDLTACVESCGNAFVQKVKTRTGRVAELYVLDPDRVHLYRERGKPDKRFDLLGEDGAVRGLTTDDILHVRGPTIAGGFVGLSPIQLHRHTLGNAVAMEEFVGRFFRNDARPGVALKFPQGIPRDKAKEFAQLWNESHAGVANAHRTGVLGGGADIQTLPVSLEDAQFVEGMRYGVADVARIFRMPKSLLEEGELGETANEVERFTKFSLLPRFRRVEAALAADRDLFAGTNLYPEFLADALQRPDTVTRYRAYKDARQGSWITANEVRALENMPPIEGGDEILVTPVGGAPNPAADGGEPSSNGRHRALIAQE